MSQSSSYWRDGACASPESPEEGDFSPQQLYHNLKSLEEHETCEDQKDPIVNIIPDNYFGCLLNSQICAPLATNDLGKLCAGVLPEEQLLKKSELVEFEMKMCNNCSQPGCLCTLHYLSTNGKGEAKGNSAEKTDFTVCSFNKFSF